MHGLTLVILPKKDKKDGLHSLWALQSVIIVFDIFIKDLYLLKKFTLIGFSLDGC
jgi:hypothetical protein